VPLHHPPRDRQRRLTRTGAGDVVLQLKSAWRDGTTHIKMSSLEFMQRLAALVPRPRLHLIRFHGVLAPHAKLRAAVVPRARWGTPASLRTNTRMARRRAWAGHGCSSASSTSTSSTARLVAAR
jgi:hypothetical protein